MTKTDKDVINCTFEIGQQRMRVEDHHRYFNELISRGEFTVEKRNIEELIHELKRMTTSLQLFTTDLQKVL